MTPQTHPRLDSENGGPDWRHIRLKYTIKSLRNGVWGDEPLGDGSDVPCIRAADFDRLHLTANLTSAPVRHLPQNRLPQHLLRHGDLILEQSGGGDTQPVGLVVRFDSDKDAVCSNFAARMVVGSQCSSRFLTYLHAHLYSAGINTKAIKQNTGIQNLDADAYLDERVPVPPLPEQRAIADFLDSKTEKIDALVAKKQRLIELLQEKRTAVISHAVTKGLDPDAPMKDSGIEWLGDIPSHWDPRPLARCLRRITYGFTNPMPSVDDGPYMLTANDIGDGEVQWDTARRTTREAFAHELTAKSRPEPGDVLVTKDGTLGRAALHDGRPACVNQSVAVLRPAANLMPAFLLYVLRAAPYQWKMVHDAGGTTIKHIYITRLAKMPVAVPPMGEQQAIVQRVTQVAGQLGDLERIVAEAIEQLREYRSALITAAVTGQIDVCEYAKVAS